MKKCVNCKIEKSLDDYYKDNRATDNCQSVCKICFLERQKAYNTSEKGKEYQRKRAKSDSRKLYMKGYQHTKKRKEYQLDYEKREVFINRINSDEYKIYHKNYRKSEDGRKISNEYNRNRYKNDIQYRLSVLLRTRLTCALRDKHKKGSAIELLGCTINEFIKYIELRFEKGMSWDNQGEWHIDHILPLSKFDLTDLEQLKIVCNVKNLQPMWSLDNLRKGAKIVEHQMKLTI